MSDLMKVGSDWGGAGTFKPLTSAISGAQRTADAHARFMDAVLAGRVYTTGVGLTAINNATFTTATTGVTATPLIGVWNPASSGKNLVLWQAILNVMFTAATNTGAAPYIWMVNPTAGVITTGLTPFNQLTLQQAGSVAKGYATTALTGMSNALTTMRASALGGGSSATFSFVGTAVGQATVNVASVENLDGSIVVPPGAIIALMATTTPVAHSMASGLIWEEVPILTQI